MFIKVQFIFQFFVFFLAVVVAAGSIDSNDKRRLFFERGRALRRISI